MKTFLMVMAVLLIAGCAQESPTKFYYGTKFKLSLPSSFMKDATVFYGDSLGVKTSSGKVFAAHLISSEKEHLPESFDIRLYPEYLLKLRPTSDLDVDLAKLFINTTSVIDQQYGLKSLEIKKYDVRTIYSVCKADECLAMVVNSDFKDHIFYAHTQKIGRAEFINLLTGGLDANK